MNELQQFYKNALLGSLCEPLCDEYKSKWRACGEDKLRHITLSLNQQAIPYVATYCNKGKGVSKEFIINNYGKYINGYTIRDADGVQGYTYGMYVGYNPDAAVFVDKDVTHFMWCETSLIIPQTACVTLYISNESVIHLACDGFNFVKVYLFDDSVLHVEDLAEDSSVVVYKYSKTCQVHRGKFALGDINEHQKELRL